MREALLGSTAPMPAATSARSAVNWPAVHGHLRRPTNAGKALQRFTDWLIDREWLAEVHEQQKDLLDAEGLSPDGLIDLLGRACIAGICSGGADRLAAVARRLPLPGPL